MLPAKVTGDYDTNRMQTLAFSSIPLNNTSLW